VLHEHLVAGGLLVDRSLRALIAYHCRVWRLGSGGNRRGNLPLLLALLAIDAGVLVAVFGSDRGVIYHRPLPELFADFDQLRYRRLRVEGTLEHRSLYRVKDACEFHFRITAPGSPRALAVRYVMDEGYPWSRRECGLPDAFCDAPGYELVAVVDGTLERDASGIYFAATQVMARWPPWNRMYPGPHETWPRCGPIPVRV